MVSTVHVKGWNTSTSSVRLALGQVMQVYICNEQFKPRYLRAAHRTKVHQA